MLATARFKKDFGYYFLGIIIPGLLNAAMIPILKHLLGTESFGAYSLKYNFILLLISTVFGGVCQGILRFKADAEGDLQTYYSHIFLIAWQLLLPIIVGSFLIARLYFHEPILLSVLYMLCIIACGLQNITIAISQANFQSKFIIVSESIRAISFFLLGIVLLKIFNANAQALMFLVLFVSYTISFFLLVKKNKVGRLTILGILQKPKTNNTYSSKKILTYGLPLVLWFSVFYLFTYLDKIFIATNFGLNVQGNYQAMFDIIFRGITIVMSPILTAIFPILNQAQKENTLHKGYILLKKILVFEIILLVVCLAIYWYFGFSILAKLLSVPELIMYKTSGALIICFGIIWQMGMLAHKPLEIAKRTHVMLVFILFSFVSYLISFYFLMHLSGNKLWSYIAPCVIAAIVYNIQCLLFFMYQNKNKALQLV